MLHAPLATGTGTGRGTRAPWSCLSNCVCVCVCVFLNTFTTTAAHMGGGRGCNMLIPLRLLRQCQMSAHVICQAVLHPLTPLTTSSIPTWSKFCTWPMPTSLGPDHLAALCSPRNWLVYKLARSLTVAHGMRRGNDDDNDIDMSSIMRWVTLGTLRLNENY